MSDEQELRAAVTLVRSVLQENAGAKACSSQSYWDALHVVTEAYLAEHPADDAEPVTEEWLRSVGFHRRPGTRVEKLWLDTDTHDWDILVEPSDSDDEWMSFALASYPHPESDWQILTDEIKTRGDVRRLCRALGIQLKGR